MAFRTDFVTQSRHIAPRVSRAGSGFNRIYPGLLAGLGFAAFFLVSVPALSQVAPDLGEAFDFAFLGTNETPTSGTVTCTTSIINGDVGTTFNEITETGCTINGDIVAPVAAAVVDDFNAAYQALDADNVCDGEIPTVDTTLGPGVYCSDEGTTIGAGVTITLLGGASDVWVFKVGVDDPTGALTGNSFQVALDGGAEACNVYWWTAAAATLTTSVFKGTILSGAAFTMTGGSFDGRALATTDATVTDAAELNFAGCAPPAEITVNKDFSDDNPDPVSVDLTCDSGTVEDTPLDASEAAPAVFTVGAADPGATCTATETVPEGYTADQTDCEEVELDGSCTIINTLNENTITVNKDFSDDNSDPVSVELSCTSGTVETTPLDASEAVPAVFTVFGAEPGATCTATEEVPVGYTADETDCVDVELDGSCTIINTLIAPPPPPPPDVIAIPTLSGWAMIMLAAFLAIFSFAVMRRQPR